jgi:hypothetical protein
MPGVTEHPYYCDHCDVGYSHIKDHRTSCPHRCSFCLADTPCIPDGTSMECTQCHGYFKNMTCYQNHLKSGTTSMCQRMGRCNTCQKWMSKKLLNGHACSGRTHCKICKKIVTTPHQCYVQVKPTPKKKKKDLKTYIYFDFECSQEMGRILPICAWPNVCANIVIHWISTRLVTIVKPPREDSFFKDRTC